MTSLPPGWAEAELSEIAGVILGQSPPGASYNADGRGMPFLQGKTEFGDLRPSFRKWTTDPRKIALCGDVLLSVRAPVGPTNLAPAECCIGRGLAALRALDGITPMYLLYGMRASRRTLAAKATGTTFEAVSGSQVRAHRLPVAPLNEQRRIVEAIEEHLSRLDAADASLAAASRRCEGLERATLTDVIHTNGTPVKPVSELALFVTDGDHNPPKRVASGVPHLTARNVKRGALTVDGASFVSPEGFEQTRKRYEPLDGDVIVTCVGTIGQTAVVPAGFVFSADRNLAAIRPAHDVDPRYLRFALASPHSQDLMANASSSTAQPHLYLRDLRAIPVPLPPLEEQRRIVAEVEERLSRIDAMRASIERAQRRSRALRAAVLARAFRGELVPQDPSDEPASVLLDRIRTERAMSEPATGRRRKTVRP